MNRPGKLAFALLGIALPSLAADSLAVKPGLWETTTVTSTSGVNIPAEVMERMPPAQRAQLEAVVKNLGTGAPSTNTARSCVTAEDIKEGVFKAVRENANKSCKFDVVSATPKHQELEMTCGGQLSASGKMVMDVIDSGSIRGEMDMQTPQVTMNMKFTSRWMGSSCAGADKD